MSALWLTLLILLLAACILFIVAGWRSGQGSDLQRNALNTAFYRQRVVELEEDESQGVVSEKAEMLSELQQTLLTDVPQEEAQKTKKSGRWILIPGVLVLVFVSFGMYFKTGGIMQVSQWDQLNAEYPQLREQLMNPQGGQLSMADLQRFSVGLRTELQQDPKNVENWAMLGRLGLVLNNVQLSSQAFERALQLEPNNQSLKTDYAEVLVRSPNTQDNRQAQLMLEEMQKQAPNDVRVLTLLAADYFGQQHYDQAIGTWQHLLTLLPAGSPQADAVRKGIEQAKTDAGEQHSKLQLTINLSNDAKKMLSEQGVLYISVTDGESPVPVAVKRLPLSHFPISVALDDSNAMVPERLLSAQKKLLVRARISRDGNAKSQTGDWFGQGKITDFSGNASLNITIDQQQP